MRTRSCRRVSTSPPSSTARTRRGRSPHPLRLAGYGFDPEQFEAARPAGRWIVTADHSGLPAYARVPPPVAEFLRAHAEQVASFVGIDPEYAARAVYDPIDANFTPLAGIDAVRRPGPNLTIWRLRSPG